MKPLYSCRERRLNKGYVGVLIRHVGLCYRKYPTSKRKFNLPRKHKCCTVFKILNAETILTETKASTIKRGGWLSGIEWTRRAGVRMSVGMIQSDHVTLLAECINKCVLSPVCDSFNFRSTNTSCQLVRHVDEWTVNSADLVEDAHSEWWSMSFTVIV